MENFRSSGRRGKYRLTDDRDLADIEVVRTDLADPEPGAFSEVMAGLATLRSAHHPNLAQFFDVESAAPEGPHAIVSERVEGKNLVEAMREEGPALFPGIVLDALRGLAFLHDLGWTHGDIRPGCLIVRSRPRLGGRLTLLDWAPARLGSRLSNDLPDRLPYLAPERLDDGGATPAADLYSLAVCFYEAIHGRPPFQIKDGDVEQFRNAVREGRRPRPPSPPEFPEGLGAWLERLLDPNPAGRPANAAEALTALNETCGTAHPPETVAGRVARLAFGDPPGRRKEVLELWEHLAPSQEPRLTLLCGTGERCNRRLLRWIACETAQRGWDLETDPFVASTSGEGIDSLASLRRRASRQPTLLLLEGIESAGSRLLEMLQRIAREDKAPPLRVLATVESDRVTHPALRALLANAGFRSTVRCIGLPELDVAGTRALAERARVSLSDDELIQLNDRARGDRRVTEALLVNDGNDDCAGYVALLAGELSASAAAWLDALAVLDDSADDGRVAGLARLEPREATEAAVEAAAAGLAHRMEGRWTLASRAIASELLQRLQPAQRKELHRRAAEQLVAEGGVDSDRIEKLWSGADDRERALKSAIEAGGASDVAGSLTRALRLLPRGASGRLELRLRQAAALSAANLPLPAARAYGAALALTSDAETRSDILGRQAELLQRGGRPVRARAVAEALLQSAETGAAARARAIRVVAVDDAGQGKHSSAAEQLERQAALPGEPEQAETLLALGRCKLSGGLPGARDALQQALALFEQNGADDRAAWCLVRLATIERDAGHYEAAEDLLQRASRFSDEPAFRAPMVAALASNALARGDFAEAVARGRESEDLARHTDDRRTIRSARRTRAVALVRCGRIDTARSLLERVGDNEDDPRETLRFGLALAEIRFAAGALDTPDTVSESSPLLSQARNLGDAETLLWALTTEAQYRAHSAANQPIEPIVDEFDERVSHEGAPAVPHHAIRVGLAQASAYFQDRRFDEARARAAQAAETARGFGLHALEASAASLESEALHWSGELTGAERTREGGRQALDRAAARLDDPELRAGFTEVPVFARLRRPADLSSSASSRKLLAIYDMIRALNSQHDPEELLTSILDMALDVVGAERGMILLRDAAGEFTVHLARNLEKETIQDASAFSRRVLKQAESGKAVLAVDAISDERLRDLKSVSMFGIHSVLCVPLRSRGAVSGAVYLDSRETAALFSEEDLEFLEAFAAHAALALQNAQAQRRLERENSRLRETAASRSHFGNIIGGSEPMRQVFELIRKVQPSELPVLIQGASGTGKELVARAIHFNGPRGDKAFVSENCAALPESLLQSELFGHVKGAFTGAERDRVGLFEQADKGTLFMDEVGDMSPGMQAQLLRVLQEGEVRRVGGDRPIHVDVRVIAATNRDLKEEVRAGRFREDLLYRLEVLLVRLPPLREREGDVSLLVDHLLERISEERDRPKPGMNVELLELLENYSWPGNVRQLENAMQRLCLVAGSGALSPAILELDPDLDRLLREPPPELRPALSLQVSEKEKIAQALLASEGNRSGAARMLGISRATIYRKIKEFGL